MGPADPLVLNGEPFCYGSRLTVRQLLELRSNGYDLTRILKDHPNCAMLGIAAAYVHAAADPERYAEFVEPDGSLVGPGYSDAEAAGLPAQYPPLPASWSRPARRPPDDRGSCLRASRGLGGRLMHDIPETTMTETTDRNHHAADQRADRRRPSGSTSATRSGHRGDRRRGVRSRPTRHRAGDPRCPARRRRPRDRDERGRLALIKQIILGPDCDRGQDDPDDPVLPVRRLDDRAGQGADQTVVDHDVKVTLLAERWDPKGCRLDVVEP